MLVRLVAKILFKACIPLVVVAGVMSYGVHLKGGDPAGLWQHVASGAFGKAGAMFTEAKTGAVGLAENLTANGSGMNGSEANSRSTEVFTWKDATGLTHYGTHAPTGVSAKKIVVNPDVNVLAPVVATKSRTEKLESGDGYIPRSRLPLDERGGSPTSRDNRADQPVQQLENEMGEPLPGVAGQLLSGGAASGNGLDPSQLIRLLQSGAQ